MGSVFTFTVAQWRQFFLLVETDYDSVLESGQHLSRAQSQSSKEKWEIALLLTVLTTYIHCQVFELQENEH